MNDIVLIEAVLLNDPLMCAVQLMKDSWLHRGWTVGDISRIISPPIKNNDAAFFFAGQDGVIAFATWGLFSEEVSGDLVAGRSPLEAGSWGSGSCLWVVDFVGTKGMVSKIVRLLKEHLRLKYPRHSEVFAIRQYRGKFSRRISHWGLNTEGCIASE